MKQGLTFSEALEHMRDEAERLFHDCLDAHGGIEMKQGLTFSEALEYAQSNALITRKGWNGKGMFVFIAVGIKHNGMCFEPCLCMRTADNKIQPGWLASQADMLATDWETVPGTWED